VQVLLSTAPDPTGATHWGQQTFSLHPAIDCAPGDAVEGTITVVRKKENHRLMEVCHSSKLGSLSITQPLDVA
jgi:protein arginine N-methyltransferase 1